VVLTAPNKMRKTRTEHLQCSYWYWKSGGAWSAWAMPIVNAT